MSCNCNFLRILYIGSATSPLSSGNTLQFNDNGDMWIVIGTNVMPLSPSENTWTPITNGYVVPDGKYVSAIWVANTSAATYEISYGDIIYSDDVSGGEIVSVLILPTTTISLSSSSPSTQFFAQLQNTP